MAAEAVRQSKKDMRAFEDALNDLIDIYLRAGMSPSAIQTVLINQATGDQYGRARELTEVGSTESK
jgi:hypothetical protein